MQNAVPYNGFLKSMKKDTKKTQILVVYGIRNVFQTTNQNTLFVLVGLTLIDPIDECSLAPGAAESIWLLSSSTRKGING